MTTVCSLLCIVLFMSLMFNIALGALYGDYSRRLKIAMLLLRKQTDLDWETLFKALDDNKDLPN